MGGGASKEGEKNQTDPESKSAGKPAAGDKKDIKRDIKDIKDRGEKSLREAFDRIDTDGSGRIDRSELQALFTALDPGWPEGRTDEAISAIDADGDGNVSFEEFARFWGSEETRPTTRFAIELAYTRRENALLRGVVDSLRQRVEDLEAQGEVDRLLIATMRPKEEKAGKAEEEEGKEGEEEEEGSPLFVASQVTIVHADEDAEFACRLATVMASACGGLDGKIEDTVAMTKLPSDKYARARAAAVAGCRAAVLVFSDAFFASRRCIMETKIISRRIERASRGRMEDGVVEPRLFLCNATPASIPQEIAYTLGGDSGQRVMFFSDSREFRGHAQALGGPISDYLDKCDVGKNGGRKEDGGDGAPRPVFNSYAVLTKDVVWPAYETLNGDGGPLGGKIWIDRDRIEAGGDWDTQISHALFDSRAAVIWLSEPFFASANCQKEVKLLARRIERGEDVRIFPVFVDDAQIPRSLRFALADTDPALSVQRDGIDNVIKGVERRVATFLQGGADDDDAKANEPGNVQEEEEEEEENDGAKGSDAPAMSSSSKPKMASASASPAAVSPLKLAIGDAHGGSKKKKKRATRRLTDQEMARMSTSTMLTHSTNGSSVVTMTCTATSIVTGSWDGTVVVWDAESLERVATLPHPARVRVVTAFGFGAGRTLLATGCGGAGGAKYTKVHIYDLSAIEGKKSPDATEPLAVFDAHPNGNGVTAIAWSDGLLYTGGLDSRLAEWECETAMATNNGSTSGSSGTGPSKWTFMRDHTVPDTPGKPTGIVAIVRSDDHLYLACWATRPDQSHVRVVDAETLRPLARFDDIHVPYPRSLALDPKTGHVLSTGKDGTAAEIDPSAVARRVASAASGDKGVTGSSSDGSTSNDNNGKDSDSDAGAIVVIPSADRECVVHVYRGHTQGVQSVMVGDAELADYLVTCGNDAVLNVWNIHSRKVVSSHVNQRNGRRWFSNTCALAAGKAFVGSGDGKIVVIAIEK